MASEPEWSSFNYCMNDIASCELHKFASEFETFIRNEMDGMDELEFFFMGEVIHYKCNFTWLALNQLKVCLKSFQAGWIAGSQSTVENIMRDGL